MRSARDAAVEIVANLKALYSAPYTILPANEAAFSHLDLKAYRQYRDAMEYDGYSFLGDHDVVEVNTSPYSVMAPTMVRVMISPDGGTCGAYYQVRPRIGRLVKNLVVGILGFRFIDAPSVFFEQLTTKHCFDFESELGATYVTTSNAAAAGTLSRPSSIDAKFFPYATDMREVRAAHEERLAAAIQRTDATPTRLSSNEDVLAMQARQKRLKDAHRATSNWITQNELMALAGGNAEIADSVFEEVQKLLAEERS